MVIASQSGDPRIVGGEQVLERGDLARRAAGIGVAQPQIVAGRVGGGLDDAQVPVEQPGRVSGEPQCLGEQVVRVDEHHLERRCVGPRQVGQDRIGETRGDDGPIAEPLGRPFDDDAGWSRFEFDVEGTYLGCVEEGGAGGEGLAHVAHSDSATAAT